MRKKDRLAPLLEKPKCKRKKFKSKDSCIRASMAYMIKEGKLLYVPKYCRRCRAWHFNFDKPEIKDAANPSDQSGVRQAV